MGQKEPTEEEVQLLEEAREAREKAFAYESGYKVGAAVLTEKGIYQGCNIEVSGRSTSVHAEMLSVFNAVMDGAKEFHTIAISPQGETGVAPCGLCQHTMAQFVEDDLEILEDLGNNEQVTVYSLDNLIGPAYNPSTRDRN